MGNYLREVRTVHTGNKLCLTTLCQLLLFFPSFWFFFCLRFLVSFLLLLAMPGNAILWLRCACAPASAPSPSTPHEANKSERDWERRQGQGKRDAKLSRAREIARWWHWLRASRKRETPRVRTNKRRQLEEISASRGVSLRGPGEDGNGDEAVEKMHHQQQRQQQQPIIAARPILGPGVASRDDKDQAG